jgi:signal transduction histidine kinase
MDGKIKNATRDLEDAYREIEKKNSQLQKMDKLKSEFLASMSHELRTPMNAIIGFTDLLEDGLYGKPTKKQADAFAKIKRSANHLLNLINDILDLSKIEAGRMEFFPEEFRLNGLLNDLKEEVMPLAEERGLNFELRTRDNITCYYDYTRLRQILMNLISNAVKFTKQGMVAVKSDVADGEIRIEVSDTGVGIKEQDMEHIFDEFVQADGSISRDFGGTGLGLSISKKLADMMDGRIEVKSEWQKGSTFSVILPIKRGADSGGYFERCRL